MVNFAGYYHIAATEIAVISTREREEADFPYVLSVTLKSGKEFSVSWKKKSDRDAEHRNILVQTDRELRQDYEKIYNHLYLLRDGISRVDKRQVRIWRQLRELLSLKDEEV